MSASNARPCECPQTDYQLSVIAEGRIVASGRHKDLMVNSVLYRELAARQLG
tara:strand:+ start:469 stop:624 length:156 start_codon:yes stop_codon:yes gene_type:complete